MAIPDMLWFTELRLISPRCALTWRAKMMTAMDREELTRRMKNLDVEEQKIAASQIKTNILLEELIQRTALMEKKQEIIGLALAANDITKKGEEEDVGQDFFSRRFNRIQ